MSGVRGERSDRPPELMSGVGPHVSSSVQRPRFPHRTFLTEIPLIKNHDAVRFHDQGVRQARRCVSHVRQGPGHDPEAARPVCCRRSGFPCPDRIRLRWRERQAGTCRSRGEIRLSRDLGSSSNLVPFVLLRAVLLSSAASRCCDGCRWRDAGTGGRGSMGNLRANRLIRPDTLSLSRAFANPFSRPRLVSPPLVGSRQRIARLRAVVCHHLQGRQRHVDQQRRIPAQHRVR